MTALLDRVDAAYGDLPYMKRTQANRLRELILNNNARNILELGFFHGKSSAYIASVLEERGDGHLTTVDLGSARDRSPNINGILSDLGLSHRVTPIFAHRSYTWELQKMLRARPRPVVDLCYLDGGHTWDVSALGVFLVDRLLRPGGILVLDDLDWSIATSPALQKSPQKLSHYSDDEKTAKPIRILWEDVLPDMGYDHFAIHPNLGWAIARKRGTSK